MSQTRAVHSISSIRLDRGKAVLKGTNGQIGIYHCRKGIFYIEYVLSEHKENSTTRDLSRGLFGTGVCFKDLTDTQMNISEETESYILLSSGDDSIRIEKEDGIITLSHRDRVVHGGAIGSRDTVLPRYPLRILGGNGKDAKARFNFRLEPGDRFYGLGDKTGKLNKRGQRYQMFNRDALGYQASISDPLYKSIPFMLKHNPEENVFSGLYFPSPSIREVDLGRESLYFFSAEIQGAPFGYVLFTGDNPWQILESFTWMTGRPSLPPLYTFGFLGSSMNYTEPDNADELVTGYFDSIEKHRIPCEGFYFSSGYVKAENGERYTFQWNRKKFPDPSGSIMKYRDRGYHIACNIKPGFLVTHPEYPELDKKGYFIKDSNGKSYKEYYWGNNASFIDFFNPEAVSWWKTQLKEKFLDYGVSGIWNDNNELELEDQNLPAQKIRSVYPVLMSKASWEVCRDTFKNKRPWIISRSGGIGIQKYARTWTGDNVSDWESMKYNIYMGMGLGLSGIPFYGHDIGGFFGKKPDTRQFIRWCQNAVFQPRFVIHSWNPDGKPTEIWTYPDAMDAVRELVETHYRYMPYIYNTAIEASAAGTPMERPLSLVFPEDKNIDPDSIHYMFGDSILVVTAADKDIEEYEVYLPEGEQWVDPESGRILQGGRTVTVEYPYKGTRFFIRTGSVVATSPGCRKLDTGFFRNLKFSVYPDHEGKAQTAYTEDDGETVFSQNSFNRYSISAEGGTLTINRTNSAETTADSNRNITFELPSDFVFTKTGESSVTFNEIPENIQLDFTRR